MKRVKKKTGGALRPSKETWPLALYKEEKMKRSTNCPRGRSTMRSQLLNIVVALAVLVAFGAMFSTDCKDDVGTSEISFDMLFELDDQMDEECFEEDFNSDYTKKEFNSNSNKEIELSKLEPYPDKVGADIIANARGCSDKVGNNFEPKVDKTICHEAEDSESSVLAGINLGNIPGNFGDVSFVLFGLMFTPANRRRRGFIDSVRTEEVYNKSFYFVVLAFFVVMLGIIAHASGVALPIVLTSFAVVGGASIFMTKVKKPEFAFAMSTSHDDAGTDRLSIACAALNEYDRRRLERCIEGFRLVSGKGKNAIEAKKTRFLELCSADVVNQAFKKVFGDAK